MGEHEFCEGGSLRRPAIDASIAGPAAAVSARPSSFAARQERTSTLVRPRARLNRLPRALVTLLSLCAACLSGGACTPTALDTVDLGDNPEPPDLALDESFFHCEIQPNVITAQGCAAGGAGEANSCHMARSALRLIQVPMPSLCQGGRLVGSPSPESVVNFERVRTSVGIDADASPLYRRPLGLDSHPRTIFVADSPAAMLLRAWLDGQATP